MHHRQIYCTAPQQDTVVPDLRCSALTAFAPDANSFFELLKIHDKKPKRKQHFENQKQSVLEAEKPESEPKERTMMVTVLTGGLALTGADIQVSENSDSNKQRISTCRKEVIKMFAC